MLGMTTIKILRGRISVLMYENGMLRRENARLRKIVEVAGVRVPPPPTDPDYSLGGHEWVDPVSGIDTWNTPPRQGAD